MRNRYILSAIGLSAVIGFVVTKMFQRKSGKGHTLIEDAGIPDQLDHQDPAQLSKADMVSEGSVYGVQYYNEVKNEATDEVSS